MRGQLSRLMHERKPEVRAAVRLYRSRPEMQERHREYSRRWRRRTKYNECESNSDRERLTTEFIMKIMRSVAR